MARTLLLIDDDRDLATLLGAFVARHGYSLEWADRPSTGLARLASQQLVRPELLLLDVMLPEQDGFAVCAGLRAQGDATPVIMLTARGDDLDRIRGLQTGADDYLAKPFNPLELVARVEAVLRRSPPVKPLSQLDPDARTLTLAGRAVPLTPSEYRLLEAMTQAPGQVFSRDRLLDLLDEAGATDSFDRAIDIHISRLRLKLETDPRQPKHMLTVRGVGYRFSW
jgi:DNA-binding response OmpR family regulator